MYRDQFGEFVSGYMGLKRLNKIDLTWLIINIVISHFSLGHVAATRKRIHQWWVSLTPSNTKTIGRMTCHCFLRPIRRDLTSSSYTTLFFRLGRLESNFARFIQNCMYKSLFKRVNWIFGLNIRCCLVDCCQSRVVEKVFHNRWQLS